MNRRIALQLYAACLFSAASLQAQQLEEVLVTATKRTESLQDVPISVAVVSGAELEKRNKTQIADISRVVPGFTFSSGTSDAGRNIILRGVGTQSFSRSVEQSVGTVIDGVASTSLSGSLLDFSDVERVEVLRGPQGMLFGKNASAGLLSITTRAPTEEPGAGFGIRYGSESLLNLNGFVSGPIVEGKLLGRISAFSNSQDPLLDNKYPGGDGLNDRDDWGTRVKLKWFATENLDAMLSYTHNERDHKCCQGALRVVVPGSVSDTEGGPVGDEVDEILDNDTAEGTTDQDIASLEINYVMGDFLLTSISAYTDAIFSDWEDAPCYSGQTEAQGCVNETQDLSGADMPSSPDWAYNLNADYYIPFASRPFTGFASATWYWRDEVQFSTTNDPLHVGDSYGTLDLSFGIAANDGRYTVQVFMLNALDDFYEADIEGQSVVGILAAHAMAYDYKRRYGMALQMAF